MPDCLILTHGAGSNRDAPLLVKLDAALREQGLDVTRINLPFREKRPSGSPGRGDAERDREGLAQAVANARQRFGRVFLGGHSYGGRQSSMLAAEQPGLIDALLLLSYPLHPPRQPEQLRTAHLPDVQTPALFAHGLRDPFGSVEELRQAIALIPARTDLIEIAGAGHELLSKTAVKAGETVRMIAERFLAFVG